MAVYCEMCGKQVPKLNKVRIDSTILNVCDDCSRFGTPADSIRSGRPEIKTGPQISVQMPKKNIPLPPVKQRPRKHKGDDVEKYQVDPDYAEIIRNGRERLAITQDELAMKILERKNVIASIERGVLMPEIKVARKLEKLLGVKILIEDE